MPCHRAFASLVPRSRRPLGLARCLTMEQWATHASCRDSRMYMKLSPELQDCSRSIEADDFLRHYEAHRTHRDALNAYLVKKQVNQSVKQNKEKKNWLDCMRIKRWLGLGADHAGERMWCI